MGMQGMELFSEQVIKLASGKNLIVEFNFRSLRTLEKAKDGDFQAVFKMFEEDFNTENMITTLWACSLKNHPEYKALTTDEIEDIFIDEIDAENFLVIKLALIESFSSFWKKAQQSKQLPDKYQSVLDEMADKSKKKK